MKTRSMSHWGYTKENGPDKWCHVAPAAKGLHQSPVDIRASDCVFDGTLQDSPLQVHYIPACCKKLANTGHGVQVTAEGRVGDYLYCWLEGGPYRHRYQLEQFHFHWGRHSGHGSEHKLDGETYASEIHFVHWNTELYSSFGEAVKSAGGLAVLGVFVRVGKEHVYLNKLRNLLSRVMFAGEETIIRGGFDPSCLLPADRSSYYTYIGSLTTPPCYESIRFIIFKDPVEISEAQMDSFRQLNSIKRGEALPRDEFRGKMLANFRPPQELNDRRIVRSFT